MSAATEQFHQAVASACGFSIQDEARRAIRYIESEVRAGRPFKEAYDAAHAFCPGYHAWLLVSQHFNGHSYIGQIAANALYAGGVPAIPMAAE